MAKVHFILVVLLLSSHAFGNEDNQLNEEANVNAVLGEAIDETLPDVLTAEMIAQLRDPFKIPALAVSKTGPRTELEMISLSEFRLTGVMTGGKSNRAILVGPKNKTYMVSRRDRIGLRNGKIIEIRPDALVIQESIANALGGVEKENFELRIDGKIISQETNQEVVKQ